MGIGMRMGKNLFTKNNLYLALLVGLIIAVVVIYKFKVEKFVNATGGAVVVTYYFMPSCGWCKKFNPEWGTFQATSDPTQIKAEKVDATTPDGQKAASAAGVTGYPTVIIQVPGNDPITYSGERTAAALNDYIANVHS